MFVQFPHPGSEHEPTGPMMDWNRGQHARKFLKAHGRYVVDGVAREGAVAFWGEWEPQSRVVETFPPEIPGGPCFLHEPFWVSQPDGDRLQNTDPLVFGDRFLYSNCRQRRNRKLRELAPGSIVLFGSKRRSEFVLDTVLVISDQSQPYMLGDSGHLDCDDWVRSVLFEPLSRGDPPPDPYGWTRAGTR